MEKCVNRDIVFIPKSHAFYKVYIDDIFYVHADHGCIKIITEVGKFSLSSTLKRFKEQIDSPCLFKIHRSYLINVNKIDSFNNEFVVIRNTSIPISQNGREKLYERVMKLRSK